jgi:60 kDa SS-A/Ro ribonucleoprotein
MNNALFKSAPNVPVATAVNEAGGIAYDLGPRYALAVYAATGTFNQTFYASAEDQLAKTKELAEKVDPEFLAKVAVYSRTQRNMKDMPAYLLAVLSVRDVNLFKRIFNTVIDNGDMLRRFVQIVRSDTAGRKSLGTEPKKMIQEWLNARPTDRLVFDSVGQNPSLGDVINLAHPRAINESQNAMFGYLVGKKAVEKVEDPKHEVSIDDLPWNLGAFEQFKKGIHNVIPNVPFQMLTALPLTTEHWTKIAQNASWTMTRMNINTFHRHGVFNDPQMVELIANRLKDKELVLKSKVFPYQLLNTFLVTNQNSEIPMPIRLALQDALEIATLNIPKINGKVVVAQDVSGSMNSPATGYRQGATSTATCVQAGALVASAMLRVNPDTLVVPFDTEVRLVQLNPRDSVMTNAQKLNLRGGGTNCGKALEFLNQNNVRADLVLYVSDNESWVTSKRHSWAQNHATGMVNAWKTFKRNNPKAKLVCVDIQATDSAQAPDDKDILNIAGFSDSVFTTVANFVNGDNTHWVDEIEKVVV